MEITYRILEIINYIVIVIASLGFLFQILFILFIPLKPKKFPKAKKLHRFAIIIPAHNEEVVIKNTVTNLLNNQTYPRDKYDVFVCADNCSDNTFKAAKEAGAITIFRNESDPSKKRAAYPIKKLVDLLMSNEYKGKYDALIKFDADNTCNREFIEKMNDALDSGVEIARCFEASSNATQNIWTKVSACYYIRDSRICSNFRERTKMNSMLSGAGMMVAMSVFEDIGSWDALSATDDSEFAVRRMLEDRKIHYVAEAVVYEDQPSTLKDTMNRLGRMGHAIHEMFWKIYWKLLPRSIQKFKFTYFDMFYQLLFIPIAILATFWFPAYYIYYIIIHFLQGYCGVDIFTAFISMEESRALIINLLWYILYVLGGLSAVYIIETFFAVLLSKEQTKIKNLKGYWLGILLSPIFMLVWDIAIVWGILTNPGWKSIKRNIKNN